MSKENVIEAAKEVVYKRIFLSGRVQGVGFRQYVKQAAKKHQIDGWVRNLRDGRVEALLAGTERRMDLILIDIQRGPSAASVSQMEIEDLEPVDSLTGDFFVKATV